MVNFPTVEFSAQLIDLSPAEEPELIVLSFVEDPDDEDSLYIQLQGQTQDEPWEGKANTYCLVNQDHAVAYGGILSCALTACSFELMFNEESAQDLECAGYRVNFPKLSQQRLLSIKDAIERILETDFYLFKRTVSEGHFCWDWTPERTSRVMDAPPLDDR